jgi:hypothetical protein
MSWLLGGETVTVSCDVDIEQTPLSFHAHAVPDGGDIRPGDSVVVHGAPADVGFGEHRVLRCTATVTRGGALARWWAGVAGMLELTELYEVGFLPKETH